MKLNLQKVKQLRKEVGLTQTAIASVLGISVGAYCKRESGQTPISLDELEKLAQHYKVRMEEFFTFTVSVVPAMPLSETSDVTTVQLETVNFIGPQMIYHGVQQSIKGIDRLSECMGYSVDTLADFRDIIYYNFEDPLSMIETLNKYGEIKYLTYLVTKEGKVCEAYTHAKVDNALLEHGIVKLTITFQIEEADTNTLDVVPTVYQRMSVNWDAETITDIGIINSEATTAICGLDSQKATGHYRVPVKVKDHKPITTPRRDWERLIEETDEKGRSVREAHADFLGELIPIKIYMWKKYKSIYYCAINPLISLQKMRSLAKELHTP